jgi:hypothetical protein
VNWVYATDPLGLNFHQTPVTRFVMNAGASSDDDGPLLSPLVNLAQMVAASPTFLTACGLDPMDPNAPLVALGQLDGIKRIYYPEADDNLWKDVTTLFPLCVIDLGASPRHATRVSAGGMSYLRPDGDLHMVLAQDDQAQGNVQESKAAFARFVGKILGDVEALAGISSNLDIVETEILFGPFTCSEAEQTARNGKLYWWTQIEIKWGRA